MSGTVVATPQPGLLDSLDDSKISRFQMKIMFVSGMGFFTDADDHFVIGIALLPEPKGKGLEQLSADAHAPPEVSRQEATALAASTAGSWRRPARVTSSRSSARSRRLPGAAYHGAGGG